MPPNIVHRDLFGVEISHEKRPLTIYDNKTELQGAQGHDLMHIEHDGDFSNLINKVLVLPVVVPKSNRTMHMSFNLMPGLDFRSGNAVVVGLRVGHMVRSFETILKEVHETKQPNSSSGFHCGRVQLDEAFQGTMVVTVTRSIKVKNAQFIPMGGECGKPYSIEIEWRVLKTRPGGAVGSEEGHAKALYDNNSALERTATQTQPVVNNTVTKLVTFTEQQLSIEPEIATAAAKPHSSDNDECKELSGHA